MENKINIAEILRDCPKGIKLYSLLYGKCEFERISNNNEFPVVIHSEIKPSSVSFTKYGHYLYEVEDADCVLFPSSKMRSWDKFFKRGDVVFNESSGLVAVFDGWVNDDYVEFNTTINLIKKGDFWGEEEVCDTECFTRVTDEERAEFIAAAEKHYGGKYNPKRCKSSSSVRSSRSRRCWQEIIAMINGEPITSHITMKIVLHFRTVA